MAYLENRAIVLKHASFEGPSRLAPLLLVARGYKLDLRELHRGDPVPARLAPGELLVVMGGSMGVGDADRPELAFLRAEIDLLAHCLAANAPVLGICLGAQLLAAAAGARVAPMVDPRGARCYEVGWAPIRFHAHDEADPVLRRLPATAQVLHWHGDACDLPAGARRLASSELCPNQAFQLGARLFGLQFHCEVDSEDVEEFVRVDGDFAVRANGPGAADQIRRDTEHYMTSFAALGDRLLRNLLDAMTTDRW